MNRMSLMALWLVMMLCGCSLVASPKEQEQEPEPSPTQKSAVVQPIKQEPLKKVVKTDEQWKKLLTPTQFDVTRKQGTESAFTGAYWNNKSKGTYQCVCCQLSLFESTTKFVSGTGWPSFYRPISSRNVSTKNDTTHGMVRNEVVCSRCDAHLGHVFDDGPRPTGLRYCLNSASLMFIPADAKGTKSNQPSGGQGIDDRSKSKR